MSDLRDGPLTTGESCSRGGGLRSLESRNLLSWAGVLVPLLIYALHAHVFWPWINDDAGISFSYARNLAAGFGLVSQPGVPPVEGFSNPMWVFLLSPFFFFHLFHPLWTPKIISLLLTATSFQILSHTLRRSWPAAQWLGPVACGLLALQPAFVIWTVSGLENPLTVALAISLLATSLAYVRDQTSSLTTSTLSGLVAGALALTRPDGLLYVTAFPLIAIACTVTRRTRWVLPVCTYGLAFLVSLGPYLIFRFIYFGEYVPNTYYAKGGPTGGTVLSIVFLYPDAIDNLHDLGASVAGWRFSSLALLGVFAACVVLLTRSTRSLAELVLMLYTTISISIFLLLPPDYMREYRFATAFFPFFYSLVLVCLWKISCLVLPAPGKQPVTLAVAVIVIGVCTFQLAVRRSPVFASAPTVPFAGVASHTGLGFNQVADAMALPSASLLAPDLGGTLFYSRLRVYDLAGLSDRVIARTLRKDPEGFYHYVFEVVRPTFIHTHSWWTYVAAFDKDPRFRRDYLPIRETVDPWVLKRFGIVVYSGDYVRRDVASGQEEQERR
jgi:hypothetical protein